MKMKPLHAMAKSRDVGRVGGVAVTTAIAILAMVSAAGAHHCSTEEELRRMIRDAGFVPKQRDTLYRTYFLN